MSAAVPNHRRTKPGGVKPGVVATGVTGPTSQIPGLSQGVDERTPVERVSGRRVGIFETDSEYTKLAKGGGHKGLLSHDVDENDKPRKPYNPPGSWFVGGDSQSGSKATSPNGQTKVRVQPLTAPFGTDGSSSWDRSPDKVSPDGVARRLDALSVTNKFKRTSHDKMATPGSMSKLLSYGYAEDKKKSPPNDDDDASSVTSEQTSTVMTEEVDDLE